MLRIQRWWPDSRRGIFALIYGAFALSLWVILPLTTMTFRHIYPITDTWVMPALGAGVTLSATVLNWLVFVQSITRSWIGLGLCIVLSGAALFVSMMMTGMIVDYVIFD